MLRDLLIAAFNAAYGTAPTLHGRAPGRVNLIGEHVDYCGLPVFPMAIQRGIAVAARPRPDAVTRVANLDPQFPPREFTLGPDIAAQGAGDWGNYLQAAGQALVRRYGELRGVDAVIASDLPIAAGLSSSAALVVAIAVTLLAANAASFDLHELMALLASGERYVGTAGGGMDQAISLGARVGHAARIEFDPVRLSHVRVPEGWRFIVAWSLSRAEKSGAARHAYNERTHQTAEARGIVARRLGLGDVPSYAQLLGARPVDELVDAGTALEPLLRRRFRHVVTEGERVSAAVAAMERDDPDRFGALMDASHASLRDDYEVSSRELDRLVDAARESGAVGARLTGAGFGGCIVALAGAAAAAGVLEGMRERFYAERGVRDTGDALFVAEPSPGAHVEQA